MHLIKALFHSLIKQSKSLQIRLGQCDLCPSQHLVYPLLCHHCLADLPRCNYSLQGADLLYWPVVDKLFSPRYFNQLFCFAPYLWPLDQWLKQLKYHNRFELAVMLSYLIEPLWQHNIRPLLANNYLLTVVPIHPKKWQQRGYNQAHLIARNLQRRVHANYDGSLFIRKEFTASQVGQSGNQRRQNLTHAFAINPQVSQLPEQIILFDDVITTGSTVNALSLLLKQRGVKTIIVLTLALTLPDFNQRQR